MPIIEKNSSAYSITPEGIRFNRNRVGPAMNTNRIRPRVSTMFVVERYRMPRATPETALMMNAAVRMARMMIRPRLPSGPASEMISTPWPIWMAARPREAAVPNRVAMMAKMSTRRPAKPSVWRWPNRVRNTELSSGTRPRR